MNQVFAHYCTLYGIKVPPWANGLVEVKHREIGAAIKNAVIDDQTTTWSQHLMTFQLAIIYKI